MERPEELPDFRTPPLTEVVLSVQFEASPGLTTPYIGLLWESQYRSKFSQVEQHAPIAAIRESFDRPKIPRNLRLTIGGSEIDTPRVWFVTADDKELIQVQQDRFLHNWRKRGDDDKYPRYEHIRESFKQEYVGLNHWLSEMGREPLVVNQCEVTYINLIEPSSVWASHADADKIFRVFSDFDSSRNDSHFEGVQFTARYVMIDDDGSPCGRLHVKVLSVNSVDDGTPAYQMELTARGDPKSSDVETIMRYFDRGRSEIVHRFAEITTDEMHKTWGEV